MSSPPNSRTNKSKSKLFNFFYNLSVNITFNFFPVHYDDSSLNQSEEDSISNQSIKSMLDKNKERKLIKVDFSALACLVVS